MNDINNMSENMPRLIAFYLPQYYPIIENDLWWGKGFTEWTNTAKATPRFPGHYQPHVPSDLGFYDLRVPEVREEQVKLAKQYGIEGFCYYHYWFGNGKRLLERPFNEVLESGKPDFPFCLCWANETWTGVWHGADNRVLAKQEYPGRMDDKMHFETLLPAFEDSRYIRVDGKPIFIVYRPNKIPDIAETLKYWRSMAKEAGLSGLFLIGVTDPRLPDPVKLGFDASVFSNGPPLRPWGNWMKPFTFARNRLYGVLGIPTIHDYRRSFRYFLPDKLPSTCFPSVVHAWDNSPRSGSRGLVLRNSSPKLFGELLKQAFAQTSNSERVFKDRLVFLKSWNEWAEGNHLEPDLKYGHAYLAAISDALETERNRIKTIRPLNSITHPTT